jgi:hypothetical protein
MRNALSVIHKPDDTILQDYKTFIYDTSDFTQKKKFTELLLAEFWYGFHQQYPETSKAAVPQSFLFSKCLGGDGLTHYAITSTKYPNRPDVHTCSPLSFQIFSNILTRKSSTIPHINTRYTVT